MSSAMRLLTEPIALLLCLLALVPVCLWGTLRPDSIGSPLPSPAIGDWRNSLRRGLRQRSRMESPRRSIRDEPETWVEEAQPWIAVRFRPRFGRSTRGATSSGLALGVADCALKGSGFR